MSLTEALAMDCEMVGAGPNGSISIVARVSLVNEHGQCVYDRYVRPTKKVTDYRTFVSGITPGHLTNGTNFNVVKKDVAERIRGRFLVGHDVTKDLKVLGLCHPHWKIRDTAEYPPYRSRTNQKLSLKHLAWRYLRMTIQDGAHSSVQDARATMKLYLLAEKDWEAWLDESDSESDSDDSRYDNSDSDVYQY